MKPTSDDILNTLEKYTNLGHEKRNNTFLRQVAFACSSPGTSAPEAAGKVAQKVPIADAISMYRFAGNDKIPLAELRDIRAKAVLEHLPKGSDLLIIHDRSLFDFYQHDSKLDRRPIGDGEGLGYEYASCIAVDPKTTINLGVVHDTVINADGPDDQDVMNYDYEPLFADFSEKEKQRLRGNHRHQMAVHINGTASLLSDWHVIDVADREFDDIFIIDRCQRKNRDFIIRSSALRNVQIPQYDWVPDSAIARKQPGHPLRSGYICANFQGLINHVPLQPYKTLPLDARNRVVDSGSAKRFAKLSIGAFRVLLYRDAKRNLRYFRTPHPVDVNVVVIREVDPLPGCNPLCWVLFTSLPTDTHEQMAYVGVNYELRWRTEDFYKLLKSGFHILKSRLNNAQKIARYLIVVTLASLVILHLKQQVALPTKGSMSDEDYHRVKTAMLESDNLKIDLNLRLFAFMAKNGGWLGRRRDPIGPTVLMRGMLYLLAVLDTYVRYGPLIEEALQNPQILQSLLGVKK